MDQSVISPAGDEIVVLTPAEHAELAGYDYPSRSYQIAMSKMSGPERIMVLGALWRHGPALDKTGRATRLLYEWTGLDTSVRITSAISRAAVDVCLKRKVNGKRCYEIRLMALPERWLAEIQAEPIQLLPEIVDDVPANVVDAPEVGLARIEEPPLLAVRPTEGTPLDQEVAAAVATSLLAQVAEIIARRNTDAPEINRLTTLVCQLEERLGQQVGYVERLRHELRNASDQLVAVQHERDGLRQRLRTAEYNLKTATSGDAAKVIDAEVKRQIARFMSQRPESAKAG